MQIIIFLAFTLLVGIISYLATRKTNEDSSDGYFLGGRSLTGIVIASSLLLTNLSTEQIIGLNGATQPHTVVGNICEIDNFAVDRPLNEVRE